MSNTNDGDEIKKGSEPPMRIERPPQAPVPAPEEGS